LNALSDRDRIADDMIKKTLLAFALLGVVLAGFGSVMYVTNSAPPVPTISGEEAASAGRPYVVKVHAQWCPVCMMTKGVWSEIQRVYSGRVNLVVLDVTNQARTDASRAEAKRLGLEQLFDDYAGATGTIVVVNGRTRKVTASISGSRDLAEYRSAIDATLNDGGR
jgi:thiol-disulfide isomerase/thioredoxin